MVKKSIFAGVLSLSILGMVLSGCGQSGAPVIPASSASVLTLSIPAKVLNSKPHSLTASSTKKTNASNALPDTSMGRLKYYITTADQSPVTGLLDFGSGSEVGTITIPLPKDGKYLVSAEWFYIYNPSLGGAKPLSSVNAAVPTSTFVEVPEFVGADAVTVQGTTSLVLDMEDIGYSEYSCYSNYLTDPSNCDYTPVLAYYDLYSFDSGVLSSSLTGGAGDIQASFDATTSSTYFSSPVPGASPVPIYTYLGNGDLVNFPSLPAGAVFYPDTLQAKTAVLGSASSVLALNDVFVVKVPSTNGIAWVQISGQSFDCAAPPSSALIRFWFIYNSQGLNYMKFQQTTNGNINCNQNYAG